MVVQHNIAALNVHRNIMTQQKIVSKSLARLSSGTRINSAADDAAGLGISERMRSQIRGLRMASQNAQNGISMLQTAEGGLTEMHSIAQRMRELAVQASNGTYSDEDREMISKEYEQLKEEITRIAGSTHYNGMPLLRGTFGADKGTGAYKNLGVDNIASTGAAQGELNVYFSMDGDKGYATLEFDGETYREKIDANATDITFSIDDSREITLGFEAGSLKTGVIHGLELNSDVLDETNALAAGKSNSLTLQIGANGGADQRIDVHADNMASYSIGYPSDGRSLFDSNIKTQSAANDAVDIVDKAINQISSQRASFGAQINRLTHTIDSLNTSMENLQAAESAIRDADMAEEMMNFVKHNIILQAAQAMMSQAANQPQAILQLLRDSV